MRPCYLLLLLFFLFGCGSSTKTIRATSAKPSRPEIKKEEAPSKIDTVKWTKIEDIPPINDDTPSDKTIKLESEFKNSYNMVMCIPFDAERMSDDREELTGKERRFVNFYGGALLALDDLRNDGFNLRVNVIDTENSESIFERILDNGLLDDADMVVGPYRRGSIKKAAEWAKEEKTCLVSPWISSSSITRNNPYYVQVKSGLIKHYETMLFHAKENYGSDELYLVVKEGDKSKRRFFEQVNKSLGGDVETSDYEVMELIPDSMTYGQVGFDSTIFMQNGCRKVFMVPYSSSRDANFAYDFLRRLQVEKRECDVVVYGMYRWIDFQIEMLEIMNAMEVRLTISNLVNPANAQNKAFKNRYQRRFGAFPTDDAYEGYDLIYFLGKTMNENGTLPQANLMDLEPEVSLQTVFDIQPEVNDDGEVQYFENQFIDLIEFDSYLFKRVR